MWNEFNRCKCRWASMLRPDLASKASSEQRMDVNIPFLRAVWRPRDPAHCCHCSYACVVDPTRSRARADMTTQLVVQRMTQTAMV